VRLLRGVTILNLRSDHYGRAHHVSGTSRLGLGAQVTCIGRPASVDMEPCRTNKTRNNHPASASGERHKPGNHRNRRKNLLAFLPSSGGRKLDRQSSTRGSRGRVLLAGAVYRRSLHSAVRGPFKPMH